MFAITPPRSCPPSSPRCPARRGSSAGGSAGRSPPFQAEAADDMSPTKQDAIVGAEKELTDAEKSLRVAQADLVAFQAGRA